VFLKYLNSLPETDYNIEIYWDLFLIFHLLSNIRHFKIKTDVKERVPDISKCIL